jgi:hypothetical protein
MSPQQSFLSMLPSQNKNPSTSYEFGHPSQEPGNAIHILFELIFPGIITKSGFYINLN